MPDGFDIALAQLVADGCTFHAADFNTILVLGGGGLRKGVLRVRADKTTGRRRAELDLPDGNGRCETRCSLRGEEAADAVRQAAEALGTSPMGGAALGKAAPAFGELAARGGAALVPRVAAFLKELARQGAWFARTGPSSLAAAGPNGGAAVAEMAYGALELDADGRSIHSFDPGDRETFGRLMGALAKGPLDGGAALEIFERQ